MFRNVLLATILAACAGAAMGGGGTRFETPYYIFETDVSQSDAREVVIRMNSMFEEYYRIAKPFVREIKKKQVIRLFSNERDFLAAGGDSGSAGYYDPIAKSLDILFSRKFKDYSWQTIQHEGFRQFAYTSEFGAYSPVWMSEGLGEYFAKGLWTGSSVKTGAVSNDDLDEIQGYISDKKLLPFATLMTMETRDWNMASGQDLRRNYSQSWSMIHFLYHAENGKYVKPLAAFALALRNKPLTRSGRGQYWMDAWKAAFGTDAGAFQQKYTQWWSSQPRNPTKQLYVSATIETLTAFLSRAFVQGQKFKDYDSFIDAAANGKIVLRDDIHVWLPPELLTKALRDAARLKTWSLDVEKTGKPRLVLRQTKGDVLAGTFVVKANRPPEVQVAASHDTTGFVLAEAAPVDARKWQLADSSKDGVDALLVPFSKDFTIRLRRKSYDLAHQEFAIVDAQGCAFRYLTKGKFNKPQTEYRGFCLDEGYEATTGVDAVADGHIHYTIMSGKDQVGIFVNRQWVHATMKDLNPANGVVTTDGDACAFDPRTGKWVPISKEDLEKRQTAEAQAASQPRPDTTPDSPQTDLTKKWGLEERKSKGAPGAQTLVIPIGNDVAANVTINPDHPEQNQVSLTQTDNDRVIFIYKAKGMLGTPEVQYSGQGQGEANEEETHIDLNANGDYQYCLMEGGERRMIWADRKWVETSSKDVTGVVSTENGNFKFDTKAGKWILVK
jgi:hypothetical protein